MVNAPEGGLGSAGDVDFAIAGADVGLDAGGPRVEEHLIGMLASVALEFW
jgi:hypothetical protein